MLNVQLLALPVTAVIDVFVGLNQWHNPVMLKKKKKQIKNTLKTRVKEPSSGLRTCWQKFTTLII